MKGIKKLFLGLFLVAIIGISFQTETKAATQTGYINLDTSATLLEVEITNINPGDLTFDQTGGKMTTYDISVSFPNQTTKVKVGELVLTGDGTATPVVSVNNTGANTAFSTVVPGTDDITAQLSRIEYRAQVNNSVAAKGTMKLYIDDVLAGETALDIEGYYPTADVDNSKYDPDVVSVKFTNTAETDELAWVFKGETYKTVITATKDLFKPTGKTDVGLVDTYTKVSGNPIKKLTTTPSYVTEKKVTYTIDTSKSTDYDDLYAAGGKHAIVYRYVDGPVIKFASIKADAGTTKTLVDFTVTTPSSLVYDDNVEWSLSPTGFGGSITMDKGTGKATIVLPDTEGTYYVYMKTLLDDKVYSSEDHASTINGTITVTSSGGGGGGGTSTWGFDGDIKLNEGYPATNLSKFLVGPSSSASVKYYVENETNSKSYTNYFSMSPSASMALKDKTTTLTSGTYSSITLKGNNSNNTSTSDPDYTLHVRDASNNDIEVAVDVYPDAEITLSAGTGTSSSTGASLIIWEPLAANAGGDDDEYIETVKGAVITATAGGRAYTFNGSGWTGYGNVVGQGDLWSQMLMSAYLGSYNTNTFVTGSKSTAEPDSLYVTLSSANLKALGTQLQADGISTTGIVITAYPYGQYYSGGYGTNSDFGKSYPLSIKKVTLNADGGATYTVDGASAKDYFYAIGGQNYTVKSSAKNSGAKFEKWEGGESSTADISPRQYTADMTLKAIYTGGSSTDSSSSSSSSSSSKSSTATPSGGSSGGSNGDYDDVPKTGESKTDIWILWSVLLASILGAGFMIYKRFGLVRTIANVEADERREAEIMATEAKKTEKEDKLQMLKDLRNFK